VLLLELQRWLLQAAAGLPVRGEAALLLASAACQLQLLLQLQHPHRLLHHPAQQKGLVNMVKLVNVGQQQQRWC
jgi:hypothetical protein